MPRQNKADRDMIAAFRRIALDNELSLQEFADQIDDNYETDACKSWYTWCGLADNGYSPWGCLRRVKSFLRNEFEES